MCTISSTVFHYFEALMSCLIWSIVSRSLYMIWGIQSGPGCSKLTTSLVNVSLKFQKSKTEICQYFY